MSLFLKQQIMVNSLPQCDSNAMEAPWAFWDVYSNRNNTSETWNQISCLVFVLFVFQIHAAEMWTIFRLPTIHLPYDQIQTSVPPSINFLLWMKNHFDEFSAGITEQKPFLSMNCCCNSTCKVWRAVWVQPCLIFAIHKDKTTTVN